MDLDELQKLCDEATPYGYIVGDLRRNDLDLLNAAVECMPALIAIAKAAKGMIPAIKEDCDSTIDQFKAVMEIEKAIAELEKL